MYHLQCLETVAEYEKSHHPKQIHIIAVVISLPSIKTFNSVPNLTNGLAHETSTLQCMWKFIKAFAS